MPYQHLKPVAVVAYSPTQAATATGIRVERITSAIRDGRLGAHRIGTKTRITADALRQWIESYPSSFRNRPDQTTEGEAHVPA